MDLGELKHTPAILQLADRSEKYPKGVVEDVLVQIKNFYFPKYFIVINIYYICKEFMSLHSCYPRCPFLAMTNVVINCRNCVVMLLFRNMTIELNIFNVCKLPNIDNDEFRILITLKKFLKKEHCIIVHHQSFGAFIEDERWFH